MAQSPCPDSVAFLRALSQAAPDRGMGTANERRAAEWIAAQLRWMGYEVAEQPFRTTRDNLYLIPAQVFTLAIAAALAALFGWVWVALAPLAYGLAILGAEVSGYGLDLTLMPRFPSQNVFTRAFFPAARTVFVTAHYDTQRGTFLFHPKFVDRLPMFFNVCYAGVLLVLLGMLWRASLWPGLAICSCALATFLAAEITGRYTPGGNDNGSGVALALWLAADYARRRADYPSGCELRFVFTGSEETGERGMKAFLRSHRGELDRDRVMFINLDNLGTGRITYLSGEGMIVYRGAGRRLLELARTMPGAFEQKNLLLPTDALPVSTLGYEAISFLGKDEAGRLGHYHWHTDILDNVDHEFLRSQQSFFREFVRKVMA